VREVWNADPRRGRFSERRCAASTWRQHSGRKRDRGHGNGSPVRRLTGDGLEPGKKDHVRDVAHKAAVSVGTVSGSSMVTPPVAACGGAWRRRPLLGYRRLRSGGSVPQRPRFLLRADIATAAPVPLRISGDRAAMRGGTGNLVLYFMFRCSPDTAMNRLELRLCCAPMESPTAVLAGYEYPNLLPRWTKWGSRTFCWATTWLPRSRPPLIGRFDTTGRPPAPCGNLIELGAPGYMVHRRRILAVIPEALCGDVQGMRRSRLQRARRQRASPTIVSRTAIERRDDCPARQPCPPSCRNRRCRLGAGWRSTVGVKVPEQSA